jgi:hypothetical protein
MVNGVGDGRRKGGREKEKGRGKEIGRKAGCVNE